MGACICKFAQASLHAGGAEVDASISGCTSTFSELAASASFASGASVRRIQAFKMAQKTVAIRDGPALLQGPRDLQWYFMHPVHDMAAKSTLSDFFVTTAKNSNWRSIADLHQPFYEQVGGISAAVVAGNHAGYVGGLTANLAIAKALYEPSAPNSASDHVGRSRDELQKALYAAYTDLAAKKAGSQELPPEAKQEVQDKIAATPVAGGNLSFRDYENMRTGRQTNAVVKGNDTPLFGHSAWERLHALLRRLVFAQATTRKRLSHAERAFCSESNEQLSETCPDGLVFFGRSLVQCLLRDGMVFCEDSNGTLEVPEATLAGIARCMQEVGVLYSNAVFEGVSSIEDSGFAFTHVYSFDMADAKYRHERNQAIIYTCGPNGNKSRYPDDVHVSPTVDEWHSRMRLVGRNVATSAAAYNSFIAKRDPSDLHPMTVLRTPLIAGGAFMLRDDEDPSKLLVPFEDHACSYQEGLLQGLTISPDHNLKRVELMHTKMKPDDMELFQAGFENVQL